MAFPRLVQAPEPPQEALAERGDDELMRLAQAGLREAFAVLVERHAKRVVGLCSRFANDAQLGRELAQDTWVLVWRGRDKYRPEGSFASWLITIARNHCRNRARRRELTASSRRTIRLGVDSDHFATAGGSAQTGHGETGRAGENDARRHDQAASEPRACLASFLRTCSRLSGER